ncbi:Vacuolar sorting protein 39/Transforming growth factor beta receptor-associated domain 2 [Dillenia turbinata]|uniref:Vacuolar sorting protein 39/Transforming growth factor beta receptor-associated domain 2 n=1 Tax=Dillenia turbinata TaxID=194707 RepID=A0AAN8UJZ7_9MAGN
MSKIQTLSPDMPLQLASDTILRMLRARLHHHRQGQIVHNLSRAIDIDSRLARLEERSRHVQINDESLCDSCHARLGTKLFAMYPDDSICFRHQGEFTSVTSRDFKRNPLFKPGESTTKVGCSDLGVDCGIHSIELLHENFNFLFLRFMGFTVVHRSLPLNACQANCMDLNILTWRMENSSAHQHKMNINDQLEIRWPAYHLSSKLKVRNHDYCMLERHSDVASSLIPVNHSTRILVHPLPSSLLSRIATGWMTLHSLQKLKSISYSTDLRIALDRVHNIFQIF